MNDKAASETASSAVIWNWRGGGSASDESTVAAARRRGLVRGGIGLLVAVALFLWEPLIGVIAGCVTLVLLVIALVSPRGLYPKVERGIGVFARWVGVGVSWVTLTVVFFLVFLPLGVVLRGLGKLRLDVGLDRSAGSYWRPAESSGVAGRHDRQF